VKQKCRGVAGTTRGVANPNVIEVDMNRVIASPSAFEIIDDAIRAMRETEDPETRRLQHAAILRLIERTLIEAADRVRDLRKTADEPTKTADKPSEAETMTKKKTKKKRAQRVQQQDDVVRLGNDPIGPYAIDDPEQHRKNQNKDDDEEPKR
jgi:hypothetical protein